MASPSFVDIPDSLLADILSRASGISQQQEQQQKHTTQLDQNKAPVISIRRQQRRLCGIFTRVNHRWRLAAVSICTGLDVSLKDLSAVKQLSSWLQHNGSQLQHLSLDLSGLSSPSSCLLSIIPSSTPQLQHLRLRGLYELTGDISAEEAAAWGGLTKLTSLEVDDTQRFGAPMQYLEHVQELSVSGTSTYLAEDACAAVQFKLPRLRVLRVQGPEVCWSISRQDLDILSGKQELQQVEGVSVCAEDLDHAAVRLLYPYLVIITYSSIEPVDAWLQKGGGMKLVNLGLCCGGQPCGSVLGKLQGLPLLRRLRLSSVGLGAGAQGLQQLTRITRLDLFSCSPALTSLPQLPPQLRELTMDNYTAQPQQQQAQQEGPTSWLQHLSSLKLSGDTISDAAMRDFSRLPQLQELCLQATIATARGGLACFSALQCLTSLTVSSINTAGGQHADFSVLSALMSLQHFAVAGPVPTWAALCIVESLAHVPAIHMAVGNSEHFKRSSGGPQEVRVACCGGAGAFKDHVLCHAPFCAVAMERRLGNGMHRGESASITWVQVLLSCCSIPF